MYAPLLFGCPPGYIDCWVACCWSCCRVFICCRRLLRRISVVGARVWFRICNAKKYFSCNFVNKITAVKFVQGTQFEAIHIPIWVFLKAIFRNKMMIIPTPATSEEVEVVSFFGLEVLIYKFVLSIF